ncbi:hypothetical protein P3491_27335, partial [Vibrio parahaemolyticus]|nr:hypothetical protein [Vibrio parahaemolyticus]
MIRLTELKLPLNHEEGALLDAIAAKLKIPAQQVLSFTLFRRGYDARKKSDIQLIYTVDVEVANPEKL